MNEYKVRASPAPSDDLKEEDLPKGENEKKEADKIPIRVLIGRLWWLALTTKAGYLLQVCALAK